MFARKGGASVGSKIHGSTPLVKAQMIISEGGSTSAGWEMPQKLSSRVTGAAIKEMD